MLEICVCIRAHLLKSSAPLMLPNREISILLTTTLRSAGEAHVLLVRCMARIPVMWGRTRHSGATYGHGWRSIKSKRLSSVQGRTSSKMNSAPCGAHESPQPFHATRGGARVYLTTGMYGLSPPNDRVVHIHTLASWTPFKLTSPHSVPNLGI